MFGLLADAVVLIHAGFVAFVVLGGLLVLRWRRMAWLHVPAAAWGAAIEFTGGICPLTPLENWLRVQASGVPYTGAFVEEYVVPMLYPATLTRTVQVSLGTLVIVLNALVYWRIVRRAP